MQLSRLLLVGLSALSVAEASYMHIGVNVPYHKNLGALARRADDDSSSADLPIPTVKAPTPETTSTKAAPATTTSADPPAEPTTTSKPPPVSVPAVTTTSPSPVSTSTKPSNNDQPPVTASPNGDVVSSSQGPAPTPSSSAGGSGGSSNNDDGKSKSYYSSVKPVILTVTQVITTTNQEGVATTMTTEALTTSSPPPVLVPGKGNKSGGGMSNQTRNTVIGVVVGIGGAIALAGLGIVAWRIRSRKRQSDEADNLMEYNDAGKPEVGGSMVGRTPFQSTLESYHAPTHVNQASNF
ncbi:hypothetical protein N0V85_006215 [Neurospora sp. IMI 360204]|nr:hypothetical protein N0V85_006215 [Neurospora sp. IMI 360204]